MRASPVVVATWVMALLLLAIGLLLLTSDDEPKAPPGSAPELDTVPTFEAKSESRSSAGRRVLPIKGVPFSEPEPDRPNQAGSLDEIVVTGDVRDWDATPATTVAVSLFLLRDGAPLGKAIARSDTDAQGRFRLVIPPPAPTECVLAAFKPGRRPATLTVPLGQAESRENVRLTLDLGAAIEGTVALDGRPIRGARVSADIKSGVEGFLPFGWNGTAFETKRAAVHSDEDGRFVLSGLAPEAYSIETDQLVSEISLGLVCQAEVVAPAGGVHLGVRSGRVRIRVFGKGELLTHAQVEVIDLRGVRMSVPHPPDLRVASGLPFTVEAAQRGFAPKRIVVPPLAAGESRELDVKLEPDGSPDLHLTLRGASELNLVRVSAQLIPTIVQNEDGVCVVKELRKNLHAERGPQDRFVLEHVPYPPGAYTLVLLPEPSESWILPIRTELLLPPSGAINLDLDLVQGGRLRVSFMAMDSSPLDGDYVLRDAAGVEVLSSTTARSRFASRSNLIAPGTYEIEARKNFFRTVRRQVTITAGSEATADIGLEPEKP